MDKVKILEVLGAPEGYYTDEYINGEAIDQINFIERLTSNLSKEEKEYLYSFCTEMHLEFMRMVAYVAGQDQ